MTFKSTFSRGLEFVTSRDTQINKSAVISALVILSIWLSVVVFTETRHEFWRDEVRAFSLAKEAGSPMDLYQSIKYEGHPVLWYLLLFIGKSIAATPLVLPITSIVIGFAAVAVFMLFAPFPLWLKCLFIFSALPLYEYSVMARNYGISMLLMFVAAALYRVRTTHPYPLALTLALLANTNVHSAVLAGLLTAVWIWDIYSTQKSAPSRNRSVSLLLPLLIVLAGIVLCAVFVIPSKNTIMTSVTRSFSKYELVSSAFDALVRPDVTFKLICPGGFPGWASLALLSLAVLGLIGRPDLFLAALGGQIAFGVFFRMVFPGYYRHQGLYLVFLLVLYWLFYEDAARSRQTRGIYLMNKIGLYVAVGILVIGNTALSIPTIQADLTMARSSNKAFGEFLNKSTTYRNAIILPEPDYRVESLPYYAQNMIYFPREHIFGTTVSFTTAADSQLYLSDLLVIARNLRTRYNRPVLIVLGHFDLDPRKDGAIRYSYNKVFSWTVADLKDFNQSTTLLGKYDSALSDENYLVYALNSP
jgi:hypothetical protein